MQKNKFVVLLSLLALISVVLTLQKYLGNDLNNYLIFKHSFWHLLSNSDLYQLYPSEHHDFYKYGPSFALLMAPFAVLPNLLGALLWSLLSLILLVYALGQLQISSDKKFAILLIASPELIGNIQNMQTNAILVALFVLSFVKLERGQFLLSALFVALAFHIKIFGLAIFALGFLYAKPWRFWFASFAFIVAIGILPASFLGIEGLLSQYQSWWNLLKWDSAGSDGFSVMGVIAAFSGFKPPNTLVQILGVGFMLLPLVFRMEKSFHWRLVFFASLLMWILCFNHKSESPTFIIAVIGFAIVFVERVFKHAWMVLIIGLVFISLLSSDLVPVSLHEVIYHYKLKIWPLIACWLYLQLVYLPERYKKT